MGLGLCSFPTHAGHPCKRPAITRTPAGRSWCGEAHVKGTPRFGRNGPCTCGSGLKFKKCCALVGDERIEVKPTGGVAKIGKKIVWSAGYNVRRWVFGYERDARWKANIIYIGPFYISRRLREPVS
jgi:SEC-C motif-containing protein